MDKIVAHSITAYGLPLREGVDLNSPELVQKNTATGHPLREGVNLK